MNDLEHDYLWKRRHRSLYCAELAVLYHRKRERFFDLCDKLAKAVAVIGGSAVFARIGGSQNVVLWAAAAITVTSTLSLVYGFADRSRRHAELAREFLQLEAEILSKGERNFSEADVDAWDAKARQIERGEPPGLRALVIVCQNELAIQQGQPEKLNQLTWYQRLFAQFWGFSKLHHHA